MFKLMFLIKESENKCKMFTNEDLYA